MRPLKHPWFWIICITLVLFWVDPVFAGPGGAIAKGLFKTWWGKTLLVLISMVLFPVFFYIRIVQYRKAQKIKKILTQLSEKHPDFAWLQLHKAFTNIVQRVYNAWSNEDLREVQTWVNHWYWQNQQQVFLNQWKRENLKNVSNLRRIISINPMYLELTEDLENSRIAILLKLEAEDYLINRETGKVVQGKPGVEDLEYIWFFEYSEGKWLLDNIQQEEVSLSLAKQPNVVSSSLGLDVV